MASHPIVHLEIPAKNTAAASKFYHDVFDWKIDVDPNFNYHQFAPESGPGGGFVDVGEPFNYKAGEVIVYIGTDDIDGELKKVEQAGGKALSPKTEIPGVGWFAFFADPTGNRMALYQNLNRPS